MQAIAKGCRLSRLNHWIVTRCRENNYTEAKVKKNLKHPLETLVELCDGDLLEDRLTVLTQQCNYSRQDMATHLLPALGGAKAYWSNLYYYVDTPEGFIVEYSINDTEEDTGWAKLLSSIELTKAAPQRKAAITSAIFGWLYDQLILPSKDHGKPEAVVLKCLGHGTTTPDVFNIELKDNLKPKDVAAILDGIASTALQNADETPSPITTYAVYILFHGDSAYIPRKLFRVVGAKVTPTEPPKFQGGVVGVKVTPTEPPNFQGDNHG